MIGNLSTRILWDCEYKRIRYRLIHQRNGDEVEFRLEKQAKDRDGTKYWQDVDGMTARSWDGDGVTIQALYEPEELRFDHALMHYLYHISPEGVF